MTKKTSKKPFKKSTEAEVQSRIVQVLKWLLEGRSRQYILREASETYKVSERQCETYLAYAYDQIKSHSEEEIQNTSNKIIENMWECYRRAKLDEAPSKAATILKEIAKLQGLEKSQLDINLSGEVKRPLADSSPDELHSLLEKLKKSD